MVKALLVCVLAVLSLAVFAAPPATVSPLGFGPYRIATGPENGTYLWMGADLAKYISKSANFKLEAQPTSGSIDNIQRLFDDNKTQFAFVQSDVYQAYLDQAEKRNAQAARLISPLRVVLPLHDEEVYFVVRADSPLKTLRDIENKRINIGTMNSGSALTATNLYQLMFGHTIDEASATTLSNEEALLKMVTDQSVEVAVVIAGQPAPLFLGMEPSVEKNFKLLRLDERDAATMLAMRVYATTVIKASNYPKWIRDDMPAFSVRTYLVTRDAERQLTQTSLVQFAKALCANLPLLQAQGHPKWRQVSLQLPPLGRGWRYLPVTEYELRQCASRQPAAVLAPASPVSPPTPYRGTPTPTAPVSTPGAPAPSAACPWSDKVMGLCGGAGR
jgi:uncharacterized protein